jgi:hypothetical protein
MGLNPRYEIRVKGILDRRWTAWFEDLQVTRDGKETVISGPVADQAALLGRRYRPTRLAAASRGGCPSTADDKGKGECRLPSSFNV